MTVLITVPGNGSADAATGLPDQIIAVRRIIASTEASGCVFTVRSGTTSLTPKLRAGSSATLVLDLGSHPLTCARGEPLNIANNHATDAVTLLVEFSLLV